MLLSGNIHGARARGWTNSRRRLENRGYFALDLRGEGYLSALKMRWCPRPTVVVISRQSLALQRSHRRDGLHLQCRTKAGTVDDQRTCPPRPARLKVQLSIEDYVARPLVSRERRM
jgi:hypothetical protein